MANQSTSISENRLNSNTFSQDKGLSVNGLNYLGNQPVQHGLYRFFRSIQLRLLRLGFFQDGDFTGPK